MNHSQKNNSIPQKTIEAPKQLVPIMQAFHAESEELAFALILDAARAIMPKSYLDGEEPSEEDIGFVYDMMKGLNPKDSIETLYAAQIVVSHMLGMRKLGSTYRDDQCMGMRLLKHAKEAMDSLYKKQGGTNQNITVNYVCVEEKNAVTTR